jgi:hypothetical protein
MGNSPSQQIVEGAQGEPEEFDLNAISEGSGDDEMAPWKKKNLTKIYEQSGQANPASPATTSKPLRVGVSPQRKLQSTENAPQPLEDYDYPVLPVQDVEMTSPTQTVPNNYSTNMITVALPSPSLQVNGAKKIVGSKRKRDSSMVEVISSAKPKKRRGEKCSPPSSARPAQGETRQGATIAVKKLVGLEALERDAELALQQGSPSPPPSPRLPLTSDLRQAKAAASVVPEAEVAEDDAQVYEPPSKRSMATSVAKRTFPFVVKEAGESSRNLQDDADDSDDAFEDTYPDNSDGDSAIATPAPPPKNNPKHKRLTASRKSSSVVKQSPKTPVPVKPRSRRRVDLEASDDPEDTDQADDTGYTGRPSKRDKKRCDECGDVFTSHRVLKEHERETGHVIETPRIEITGRFSDDEIKKLEKFKSDFCRMHDIANHEFNNMMTDSTRRLPLQPWPYDIITKQDFLEQFYDVLPNRNKKSLARFRERNWQNATGLKDWTVEDDDQLTKLVRQLGGKWVEIGQAMTRTQDAVQQRWKKHLQYKDTKREGVWSPEETELLEKAIAAAKQKSGLAQDPSTDKRVAWTVISDALEGVRTPKQCSDHWCFLSEVRGLIPNRYRARMTKAGRKLRNPSYTPRGPSKKSAPISSTYVHDSESEVEGDSHANILSIEFEDAREDGDQGHQLESPELPPAPSRKTPKQIMTLSQAFANTQANTSALRRSQRHELEEPSDRPSPRLPSRARVHLPTIQAIPVHEDEEEIAETEEPVAIQEPSTFHSSNFNTSQNGDKAAQNASESESEEESKTDSEEDEEMISSARCRGLPSPELAASCDRSSHGAEPTKEEPVSNDDDLQPLPDIGLAEVKQDKKTAADADDTSSSGESGTDTDADDEDEDEDDASESGSDDDGNASEDSMEKDTRNDFMESIKQSARKAALVREKKIVKPVVESESESESDSDGESIAHG